MFIVLISCLLSCLPRSSSGVSLIIKYGRPSNYIISYHIIAVTLLPTADWQSRHGTSAFCLLQVNETLLISARLDYRGAW